MKLIDVRHELTSFAVLTLLTLGGASSLTACGGGGGNDLPVIVMNPGRDSGAPMGCIQPSLPPEQPDVSLFPQPKFVTDNPNGQATVRPGNTIEAEITVNAATRYALVELRNDGPIRPQDPPISTWETESTGKQTLEVLLPTVSGQRFGRYYMKITLCGLDCDDQEVIFDMNPDVNSNYERTVFEDGVLVRTDRTCIDFLPQATVLIQ